MFLLPHNLACSWLQLAQGYSWSYPLHLSPCGKQPENRHYFPIQQPMSEELMCPADACFECRFFFKRNITFLKRLFLMWTVLKIFIEFFLQYCFCFKFWLFGLQECGIVAPLIRDWTCTQCVERQSLNHWAIKEVPCNYLLILCLPHQTVSYSS